MATSPFIFTTTVSIANGASLSGAADLNGANLTAILMPAAWTAAGLSFQGSFDGTTFGDIYARSTGLELVVPSAGVVASGLIMFEPGTLLGLQSIKIRSGTTGAAVNQGAARTLTLALRKFA